MTENRRFGSSDFDEIEDSELSLCCICGKTFTDRRSLHLHVAIVHEDSETPPIAHSSTFHPTDDVDNRKNGWLNSPALPFISSALLAAAAAATSTVNSEECGGESSDDSCHPQDLRIRRSPVDTLSSGSVSTAPLPTQAPIQSMSLLSQNLLNHQTSPSDSPTNQASFLYQRYHDVSTSTRLDMPL
ncbi:unnamed protein product [Hymenolepis diminuta]|uniref:C2H2-type domain-containing protein n=1 Tax=Hymenolepis diminuta TaxID=6216 RepID=A0A0R3ST25_HYMDI|nr:unnamed protein product [Hymenolepis diminuta]